MSRRAAVPLGIAVGIALRLGGWLFNHPLWLDEAMLSLGVLSPSGRPLPYGQVAPVGFIAAQRLAVAAFGRSELALRVVPLLAGIAAVPLFALLARRLFADHRAVALAVWLFAVNRALVYYSAEAKPYSTDVALAVAMIVLVYWAIAGGARREFVAGVVGAACVWFSYPVVLVLGGLALVWRAPRAVLLWAASAVPAVWLAESRVSGATRAYLVGFWPMFAPVRGLDELLRMPPGIVWLVVAAVGMWVARRDWTLALAPVVVAVAAAVCGLYPLASRLLLYLVPLVLLGVAGLSARRWGFLVGLACLAAQSVEVLLPTGREDVRAIAAGMASRRSDGDAIYVYYAAVPTFSYYARADTVGVVRGGCHRGDWRGYLRELDALRGRPRVWIVVAHAFDGAGVQEDSLLVRYLNATGRLQWTITSNNAFAELYDLSDLSRAGAATADRFVAPLSGHHVRSGLACGPM